MSFDNKIFYLKTIKIEYYVVDNTYNKEFDILKISFPLWFLIKLSEIA